jgi:hypothetical protein
MVILTARSVGMWLQGPTARAVEGNVLPVFSDRAAYRVTVIMGVVKLLEVFHSPKYSA